VRLRTDASELHQSDSAISRHVPRIIHGVALQKAQFSELATNGVGLIWSPHRNIALQGKTVDITVGHIFCNQNKLILGY
jgi:hypothetical protein